MQITEFEVVDHGFDGPQYFQGFGVIASTFDHVAIGNGDTFAEAIEDALESMAQCDECTGVDFDLLEMQIAMSGFGTVTDGSVHWNESESASDKYPGEDSYYVSIRYSTANSYQA